MHTDRYPLPRLCGLASVLLFAGLAAWLALQTGRAQAAPMGNLYVVGANGSDMFPSSCSAVIGHPDEYSCNSLRAAVIAANANPGSTIQLTHGATYDLSFSPNGSNDASTGDLNITADTTFAFASNVICMSNCAATIEGAMGDRLLRIAPGVRVSAYLLHLRYGNPGASGPGGAVLLDPGSLLTLTNSTIDNNYAENGGGIAVHTATLMLIQVQVISNTAFETGLGAGILNLGGAVTITGSMIRANTGSMQGGGIANTLSGTLSLSRTVVALNGSTEEGGGIFADSGHVTLAGSQLITNTTNLVYQSATNGAGLAVAPAGGRADVVLDNVDVVSNTGGGSGGGVYIRIDYAVGGAVFMTITGGTIRDNIAEFGGGLDYTVCSTCVSRLLISGTQVLSNTATGSSGGGMSIASSYGCTSTIVGSTIAYNRVGDDQVGWGGGINSNGPLDIRRSRIYTNTATIRGGGLFNTGGTVWIAEGSRIEYNTTGGTANDFETGGAGVYNYGDLTLDDSTIAANHTITGPGGGLTNRGTAVLRNSGVTANRAGVAAGGVVNGDTGILKMTGGSVTGNSAVTQTGGVVNTYRMLLDHVHVDGNSARYIGGLENGGELTVTGGTISDNTGSAGIAGLYNEGTLYAIGVTLTGNRNLTAYGGALQNRGTAVVVNTLIVSNSAVLGWGAGIMNDAPISQLTLSGVAVLSNTGQAASGIYNNAGTLTMTASTIAHNVATGGPGGGILNTTYIPAQNLPLYGSLWLDGSAVFDNRASGQGGGIYNSHLLTITNSTLSDNRAGDSGGGLLTGAGYNPNPSAYLNNVTIAGNVSDSDNDGAGKGGGVAVITGTVLVRNTLIGQNSDLSNQAPDCSGTLTSGRFNLLQDTQGCVVSGYTLGNISGNPLLGPLQNNGGPTWTRALLTGSPAINTGNPTAPGSGPAACMVLDQRGVKRPSGGGCDIGAYEYWFKYTDYLPVLRR
jgi:fibronectin-binding autotransporter adhesin